MSHNAVAEGPALNGKFNMQIPPNRTVHVDCNTLKKNQNGQIYKTPEFLSQFDAPPLYPLARSQKYYTLPPNEQMQADLLDAVGLEKHLGSGIDANHKLDGSDVAAAMRICIGTPGAMSKVRHPYNPETNTYELVR
jgi:hypothetical protein